MSPGRDAAQYENRVKNGSLGFGDVGAVQAFDVVTWQLTPFAHAQAVHAPSPGAAAFTFHGMRVFGIDITPKVDCGGHVRFVASIEEAVAVCDIPIHFVKYEDL